MRLSLIFRPQNRPARRTAPPPAGFVAALPPPGSAGAGAPLPALAAPRTHLAAYLSHGSEIDTRPLAERRARALPVLLPVVPARGRRLRFTALDARPRWRQPLWHPRMPGPARALSRATHVLLPLLGFDAAGRRLGGGRRILRRHPGGAARGQAAPN